jgi:hypothetical protein
MQDTARESREWARISEEKTDILRPDGWPPFSFRRWVLDFIRVNSRDLRATPFFR